MIDYNNHVYMKPTAVLPANTEGPGLVLGSNPCNTHIYCTMFSEGSKFKYLYSSVADPDSKDPNHLAGSRSEILSTDPDPDLNY